MVQQASTNTNHTVSQSRLCSWLELPFICHIKPKCVVVRTRSNLYNRNLLLPVRLDMELVESGWPQEEAGTSLVRATVSIDARNWGAVHELVNHD